MLNRDTIDQKVIREQLVRVQKNWNETMTKRDDEDDEVIAFKGRQYTLTKKLLGEVPTEDKVYKALAKRWLVKNSRKFLKANMPDVVQGANQGHQNGFQGEQRQEPQTQC